MDTVAALANSENRPSLLATTPRSWCSVQKLLRGEYSGSNTSVGGSSALPRGRPGGNGDVNTTTSGATSLAVLTVDRDRIVTSWNPGAERIFGYPSSEMLGRPVTLMIPAHRLPE